MAVQVGLKWNGFQSNILSKMKELYKDEDIADVTVESDGHSYKAHKFILWANSSVFRTIFQQNPQKDSYYITLHGINPEALETLITYMYNGEVNVSKEFLSEVLKTAEVLKICGLVKGCFEDVEESLGSAQENNNADVTTVDDNLDNIYSITQKRTRKSVSKISFDETQNKWISETNLKTCSNPDCTGDKDDNDDMDDTECCACKAQNKSEAANDSSPVPSKPKKKKGEATPRAMVKTNPDTEYIKQFPCLYDANHVNYTNRRIVKKTTHELQAILNSKSDTKYSFEDTKKLITLYRRFLMRQRRTSDPVEISPDAVYVKQFPCLYDPDHKNYSSRCIVKQTTYELQALLNSTSSTRYSYEDTQDLVRDYRRSLMLERLIPGTNGLPESTQLSPAQTAGANEDSVFHENTGPTGNQGNDDSKSNLEHGMPLPSALISGLPIEPANHGPEPEANLHVPTQPAGVAAQANITVGVDEFTPENTVILSTGFQGNTATDSILEKKPSTPLPLEQVSELLIGLGSEADKEEHPVPSPSPLAQSADANIMIGHNNILPDSTGLTGFNVASEPTRQPESNLPLTLAQITEFLTEPASCESDDHKNTLPVPTEPPSAQIGEANMVIGLKDIILESAGYQDDSSQSSLQGPTPLTLEEISEFLIEPGSGKTDVQKDSIPVPTQSPPALPAQTEVGEYLPENAGLAGYQGNYEFSNSLQQETNTPLTLAELLENLIEPASYESEAQKDTFPLSTLLPLGQTAQATITIGLNEFLPQNTGLIDYQEHDAESSQEPGTALTSEQISEFLILTPRADGSAT